MWEITGLGRNMVYSVEINGIEVNATYTEEEINEIFIPLLKRLTQMQQDKKGRVLCMLAAPPGAGKTTLLHFLQHLSETTEGIKPVQIIGMDGFHRYQDYLVSHTTVRDGVEISMVQVKGAPETFDLDLLKERIRRVAAGERCGWPEYNRMTHNPVEDAITVDGDIVLLEGNYLLLDEDGWSDIKDYADYTVKISAEEDMLKQRLVDRKAASNGDYDEAVRFVEYSDLVNVRTCLARSAGADMELVVDQDGRYGRIGK